MRSNRVSMWFALLLVGGCGGQAISTASADATTDQAIESGGDGELPWDRVILGDDGDGSLADSALLDSALLDSGTKESGQPPQDGSIPMSDSAEPYPVVDASGSCAPATTFPPGSALCCADTIPCVGKCVLLPSGKVGCDCYGVLGGCWPDGSQSAAMCCDLVHGCATPQICFAGH